MKEPSLIEIDGERKRGLRPEVIMCFTFDSKLLFVLKREYRLWQLPQGTVENREDPKESLKREVGEELGKAFALSCEQESTFFGEDESEFLPEKYGMKELKTDAGEEILMKGKKYYFYAMKATTDKMDLSETEFDDYIWFSYNSSIAISQKMYQPSKRRISAKIADSLKEMKLIS